MFDEATGKMMREVGEMKKIRD